MASKRRERSKSRGKSKTRKTLTENSNSPPALEDSQKSGGLCFLTFGTTNFDEFLRKIDEAGENFLDAIQKWGIKELVIQIGATARFSPDRLISCCSARQFPLEIFPLVPSIAGFLERADLVISHAGAGSILEALRCRCALIVVVNDSLMGNHQVEVAEALGSSGFLHWATPANFLEILKTKNLRKPQEITENNQETLDSQSALRIYPTPKTHLFSAFLDEETKDLPGE